MASEHRTQGIRKPYHPSRRRVAWNARSELFLDTGVDLGFIARRLGHSGFGVAEREHIRRGEVAPLPGGNLLSVAGVWDAFDLGPVEACYRARVRAGMERAGSR